MATKSNPPQEVELKLEVEPQNLAKILMHRLGSERMGI
jgi:hypothetical protein